MASFANEPDADRRQGEKEESNNEANETLIYKPDEMDMADFKRYVSIDPVQQV